MNKENNLSEKRNSPDWSDRKKWCMNQRKRIQEYIQKQKNIKK